MYGGNQNLREENGNLREENRILSEEVKRLKKNLADTKESIAYTKKIEKSLKGKSEKILEQNQTEVKKLNDQLNKAKQRTEALVQQNLILSCEKERNKKTIDELKSDLSTYKNNDNSEIIKTRDIVLKLENIKKKLQVDIEKAELKIEKQASALVDKDKEIGDLKAQLTIPNDVIMVGQDHSIFMKKIKKLENIQLHILLDKTHTEICKNVDEINNLKSKMQLIKSLRRTRTRSDSPPIDENTLQKKLAILENEKNDLNEKVKKLFKINREQLKAFNESINTIRKEVKSKKYIPMWSN